MPSISIKATSTPAPHQSLMPTALSPHLLVHLYQDREIRLMESSSAADPAGLIPYPDSPTPASGPIPMRAASRAICSTPRHASGLLSIPRAMARWQFEADMGFSMNTPTA